MTATGNKLIEDHFDKMAGKRDYWIRKSRCPIPRIILALLYDFS